MSCNSKRNSIAFFANTLFSLWLIGGDCVCNCRHSTVLKMKSTPSSLNIPPSSLTLLATYTQPRWSAPCLLESPALGLRLGLARWSHEPSSEGRFNGGRDFIFLCNTVKDASLLHILDILFSCADPLAYHPLILCWHNLRSCCQFCQQRVCRSTRVRSLMWPLACMVFRKYFLTTMQASVKQCFAVVCGWRDQSIQGINVGLMFVMCHTAT